jgi:SpoVK/Ycf46/Vps4 family AAA+-type ATPase
MESSAKLFSIRPSEVLSKYQGESERYISQLFENAQKLEKAIIFFDGRLVPSLTF